MFLSSRRQEGSSDKAKNISWQKIPPTVGMTKKELQNAELHWVSYNETISFNDANRSETA